MDSKEEFRKKLYDEIIIKQISRNNNPESARKCIETLLRVVKNIVDDPKEEKKRKLKEETNAFKKNIRRNKGGVEFLVRIGFKAKVISFEKYFIYELPPDNDPTARTEKMERLKIAQDLLQDFLEKAQERAEIIERMEAREKIANEIQKKSVLESIEDDKIRRAEARKRSKETKEIKELQHKPKENEQNQPKIEEEETTESYRSYNSSHYRQHND
ncbi:7542_t:CDS:1 [Diversispora eburnea]|uniref:7542_t:CDS:1 n=1 Tax=Diversispora eburnea TaxID=1213867 RepID=A0A9N8YSV0_9GLOM|nr:7542_t:CDS:1 [Diversispora eburnea]